MSENTRTFGRTSKHPEILGRLDVRLNVLQFQDIYTYFLGRLDIYPKQIFIWAGYINVVLKMMMMMNMMIMIMLSMASLDFQCPENN